jgi:hypothetical protein
MTNKPLSAEELRGFLVTILAGATGSCPERWDRRLGELVRVDLTRSPTTNWQATGCKKCSRDGEVIRKAISVVQKEHPYVAW